jgi:hypothetical protein
VIVAPPPPAALAVSPIRVELAGAGSATIRLTNTGSAPTTVDGARAGFAIDVSGRPRAVPLRDSGVDVLVRPGSVVLAPRSGATATIVVRVGPRASPGDHASLVVFATRPRSSSGVGVRLRVGVVVLVRVPGTIVHRLRLAGIGLVRRTLVIGVRNLGNVVERLDSAALGVRLLRGGRVVRRVRIPAREVLPGGRAVIRVAAPPWRGRVIVELRGRGSPTVRRWRKLHGGV